MASAVWPGFRRCAWQALELRRRHHAGHAHAVGEEERRRTGDAELVAERDRGVDRVGALAVVVGDRAFRDVVVPGLVAVGRAPDLLGGLHRLGMQAFDGIEEGVDGDVVHLAELGLELAAEGAIDVGEQHQFAFALALHGLDRVVERKHAPVHRLQFGEPRLGEVAARLQLDDVAGEDVLALGVHVDELAVDIHFVQPAVGRFCYRGNLRAGKTLAQRLADDRFAGMCTSRGDQAGSQREAGQTYNKLHVGLLFRTQKIQDIAARTSAAFSSGRRSTTDMPALRSQPARASANR